MPFAQKGQKLMYHQFSRDYTVRLGQSGHIAGQALHVGCPHTDRFQVVQPTAWRDRRPRHVP
jgi:hypothetical protein